VNVSGLALADLEERWGALPATLEVRTGGHGRHLWFACDEELPSAVLAPGLELKAERSVITAPPSVHATGRRYVWVPGRDPDELTPATVPLARAEPHVFEPMYATETVTLVDPDVMRISPRALG